MPIAPTAPSGASHALPAPNAPDRPFRAGTVSGSRRAERARFASPAGGGAVTGAPTRPFDLSGKVALVSWAAGGVGRAAALALAEAGADVAVASASGGVEGTSLSARIRERGRSALDLRTDLTDPSKVAELVDSVVRELDGIDILVHEVPGQGTDGFLEARDTSWEAEIGPAMRGSILLLREVAREMVRQGYGGRVVLIVPTPPAIGAHEVPVASAHEVVASALVGLTRTLAHELAPYDITVNTIVPGHLAHDPPSEPMDPDRRAATLARIPKGRLGRPDDVAALTVYLASDEADYCTGAEYRVDGGFGSR